MSRTKKSCRNCKFLAISGCVKLVRMVKVEFVPRDCDDVSVNVAVDTPGDFLCKLYARRK